MLFSILQLRFFFFPSHLTGLPSMWRAMACYLPSLFIHQSISTFPQEIITGRVYGCATAKLDLTLVYLFCLTFLFNSDRNLSFVVQCHNCFVVSLFLQASRIPMDRISGEPSLAVINDRLDARSARRMATIVSALR